LRLNLEAGPVEVKGAYTQSAGGVLEMTLGDSGVPALTVGRTATLEQSSVLELRLDPTRAPAAGETLPVIRGRRLTGEFDAVNVDVEGYVAVPEYTAVGMSVRLEPIG
jgi:hypothetical protein